MNAVKGTLGATEPRAGRPPSGRAGAGANANSSHSSRDLPRLSGPSPTPKHSFNSQEPRRRSPGSSAAEGSCPAHRCHPADQRQKLGAEHCVSPSAPGSGWMGSPGFEGGHCKAPVTSYSLLSVLGHAISRNKNGQTSLASRNPLTGANVEKPTANTRQY